MPQQKKYLKFIIMFPIKLRESVIALLDSISVLYFEEVEEDDFLKFVFYKDYSKMSKNIKEKIKNVLESNIPELKIDYEIVPEKFWEKLYREGVKEVTVGQFLIKPPWSKKSISEGCKEIIIEPGMAFGTGLHPTTQQCILSLERDIRQGDIVMDIGTGSGILAFAANMLGAGRVIGIDIDKSAIEQARKNAALNKLLNSIEFINNSWENLGLSGIDIIVANLTKQKCHELIASLARGELKGRNVILSGFYRADREGIERELHRAGYYLLEGYERDSWITVRAENYNV